MNVPTGARHVRAAEERSVQLIPGYTGRFVHGQSMTVAFWAVTAGHEVPEHTHPHEQIVNVVEGSFEMRVGGETFLMAAGDSVTVPGGVVHSAWAHTDVRCIDVFHPVREDYRI